MRLRCVPLFSLAAVAASGTALACTPSAATPMERLVVRSGWARLADSGATSGAYLEIANNDTAAVTLVGITADVATAAEVHESMQHEGMAHMIARTELPIAAGSVLSMQPGGLHVMLVGLRRALAVGDQVSLRLRFSNGTEVAAVVPVNAP